MEVVNETLSSKMIHKDDSVRGPDNFDCSYGIYGVFAIVVLFQTVNLIIKLVGPPKSLRADEWKWRNLTISWLHALFSVSLSMASLVLQTELLWDLRHYKSNLILFLLTFSTGYFLYDFLDIIFNGMMFAMWEVQLHHVAVGGMFYYNLVNCDWLAFNIIALLVEVNSFFLHQRKLLQMLGTPYTCRLYRVTIFLNITTFVVFRGIPLAAITWAMTQWYHTVTLTYYVSLFLAMLVMVVMNPILFMRLLRSDYLRGSSSARQRGSWKGGEKAAAVNGNNNHLDKSSSSGTPNHVKQS
ncbi:TLC domain-containing protein 2-like [Babylonia areolata]|uniref:TLC domain-containing protein 2-like n=1 Tax=Babylonia areolata TaxID=304850 RepID=UPI003FD63192